MSPLHLRPVPSVVTNNTFSTNQLTTDESEVQSDSVTGYEGHATQILWKSTERLGCATTNCDDSGSTKTYLVCQYDPP